MPSPLLTLRLNVRALALLLPVALGAVTAEPAHASSPQAWAAYGQQVLKACTAASGLRSSRAAGDRLDLPATATAPQLSVLLLEGTYPQPHMAGRRGLELCVYDARSKSARVAEADRLGVRQP